MQQDIGNVTEQSCLSVKLDIDGKLIPSTACALPFQLHIRYTRPSDGMRAVRVYHAVVPVISERPQVESGVNVGLFAVTSVHRSICDSFAIHMCQHTHSAARLASQGRFAEARADMLAAQKLMQRVSVVSEQNSEEHYIFVAETEAFERELASLVRSQAKTSSDNAVKVCITVPSLPLIISSHP